MLEPSMLIPCAGMNESLSPYLIMLIDDGLICDALTLASHDPGFNENISGIHPRANTRWPHSAIAAGVVNSRRLASTRRS